VSQHKGIIKSIKIRLNKPSFQVLLTTFQKEAKELFDIAACKCDFSMCNCDKLRRVPVQEQLFLSDQRSLRLLFIGSADHMETKRRMRRKSRSGI